MRPGWCVFESEYMCTVTIHERLLPLGFYCFFVFFFAECKIKPVRNPAERATFDFPRMRPANACGLTFPAPAV